MEPESLPGLRFIAENQTAELCDPWSHNGISVIAEPPSPEVRRGTAQELRPMFGFWPWFAFLRRALAFFLWVRFDIGIQR